MIKKKQKQLRNMQRFCRKLEMNVHYYKRDIIKQRLNCKRPLPPKQIEKPKQLKKHKIDKNVIFLYFLLVVIWFLV